MRPACAGETSDPNPIPLTGSARTGKIARLPQAVREDLNRRLRDGQPGKELVAWLNTLPEVQAILSASFEGRPITEQNLSEWRSGGYREWQHWEKTRELTRALGQQLVAGEGAGLALEALLARLSRLYASMACESIATADPQEGFRLLRRAFLDLSRLQRADLQSRRLALQKARQEWQQEQQNGDFSRPIRPDPAKSHPSPETAPAPWEHPPKHSPIKPPASPRREAPPIQRDVATPEIIPPLTSPEPWWTTCASKPTRPGIILNRPPHSRRHPIQSDQIQPESTAA